MCYSTLYYILYHKVCAYLDRSSMPSNKLVYKFIAILGGNSTLPEYAPKYLPNHLQIPPPNPSKYFPKYIQNHPQTPLKKAINSKES